jgi:CelD/BcsL family acetyltransferase involved in cellulose biosynthesis
MLTVERLATPDALAAIAAEWERLDASLSPRTPFTTPLWNCLWWQHFREERFFIRDELFAHAVRKASGELVAVAPMMLTHRPRSGPMRVRMLQFFGSDVNITEIRGLVCRPADQAAVMDALSRHLRETERRWDWLHWCGIREQGAAADCDTSAIGDGTQPTQRVIPNYFLVLPPSWEELKAGLSRNIKESLRKCYNSLKRDGHDFEFNVVSVPAEVDAALDRFFQLHAARASTSNSSIAHPDVFAAERSRNFLRDYALQLAKRDQLRIFQLVIGGHIVATRIGFILGDELYLYYSGYDPEWGRYSVMTTAVAESIRWAIGAGFRIVNLSAGKDVSKTRWSPQEVLFSERVELAPSRRSRFAFQTYYEVMRKKNQDSTLGRLLLLARRGG